jgi:hypothetical protein
MSNKLKELDSLLFNKITMVKPKGYGDDTQWFSPDAHVIAMVSSCVNHVSVAFETDFWPELTKTMCKAYDLTPEELEQHVVAAFKVIHDFFKRATDGAAEDITYLDALNNVAWDTMHPAGRVAYMSMVSQYFFARFWVACRQLIRMGVEPSQVFEKIAGNAEDLMRLVNENIEPEVEAVARLKRAVAFAKSSQFSNYMINQVVEEAILDNAKKS